MTTKFTSLGDLTNAIRTKSDGLENVHTEAGTFQNIKTAQTRISDTYSRLMVRVIARNSICGFLNIDSDLEWTAIISKLAKAKEWLHSVTNDWDVTALSELHDVLTAMQTSVQLDLNDNWIQMVARIEVARTRLGFIDTVESDGLERALRLYDAQTNPQSMADSIEALRKAEELITRIGIGNAQVEKFLEQASSREGASLDSMNDTDVKSWLDEDDRREKFVIRFKGRGN